MEGTSSEYKWCQTRYELTLTLQLPEGTHAHYVRCTLSAAGQLCISLHGWPSALLDSVLHRKAELNTWTVDGGILHVELDKAEPKFWKCAIDGGPIVDVKQVIESEKREKEPIFKPSPDALTAPWRVTDRELLQKLQAEFPQLELDLGPDPHVATHRSYTGVTRAFDWGAIPAPAAEDSNATRCISNLAAAPSSPEESTASASLTGECTTESCSELVAAVPAIKAASLDQSYGPSMLANEAAYCWGPIPGSPLRRRATSTCCSGCARRTRPARGTRSCASNTSPTSPSG